LQIALSLPYILECMRRKDREMPAEWALEVFDCAPYATLSLTRADGTAYGVPVSHVRGGDNVFYFHCANDGEKLDAIAAYPEVCLSAVSKCHPLRGPIDRTFTLEYKSAIAFGRAEKVTSDEEKKNALRLICERYLPRHMEGFDDAAARSLINTTVVRITLTSAPTGKRKQYDEHGVEMKHGRME